MIKIANLMNTTIISAQKHDSIAKIRSIFSEKKISSVAIVNGENEPIGIVSPKDLVNTEHPNEAPVSSVMKSKVHVIPQYNNVDIAARIMRNKKVHHLLVTHEKKLVGIISSFDLLKLVENKRFVEKNPSNTKKH